MKEERLRREGQNLIAENIALREQLEKANALIEDYEGVIRSKDAELNRLRSIVANQDAVTAWAIGFE